MGNLWYREYCAVPCSRNGLWDAFFEGEQDLDGGGHPPSRAGNGTFTPRNSPRIPDLQFVQISEITICYFTPLFLVFGGPTPLECPHSRPPPVQTAAEVEQTHPVRGLCSDWANCVLVRCCTPSGAMLARAVAGDATRMAVRDSLVHGGSWWLPGGVSKRPRACVSRSLRSNLTPYSATVQKRAAKP